jgi:hypothetical protein
VSGLGLVWNLLGVAAFVVQMTSDLTTLPEPERLFYESRPAWATAAFGVAVASGVLGCLALLLRKSWAAPMLILCLAGIVVQVFHSIALTNGIEVFGPQGLILPVAIFAVAAALTVVARMADRRGWSA